MADYSEDLLKRLWNRLREVSGKDKEEYRLDPAGALIKWSERTKYSLYGWQVDHACPRNLLSQYGYNDSDIDEELNLRPFNTNNNQLKKDEYPRYTRSMYYDSHQDKNIEDGKTRFYVNYEVQKKIVSHFDLPATLLYHR